MTFTTTLRACPICRQVDRSVLFAEANIDESRLNEFAFASRKIPEYMHHRLMLCAECDLLYVSPVPKCEEVFIRYLNAAFDSQAEAASAAKTYARLISSFISQLPDLNGALDIGTGDGVFLKELLRLGFTAVRGIEPSTAPVENADAEVAGKIDRGFFGPGLYDAESFSLVTCFQTIEHVNDPQELLNNAWVLLKERGVFCLIAHNRRSLSARMLGRRSPIFDVEHLQLFSSKSLVQLFQQAGFDSVSVRSFWNQYPLSYWVRLFPFPATAKRSLIELLSASRLGRLKVYLPAGNLIAWGVKVPDRNR